jgi:hypothetical protein
MPTSQVLVILIANPFFSFLILASPASWPSQLQPPSLDPELISRISGSFGASPYNITIPTGIVKTPGEIFIADFRHSPCSKPPGAPVRPSSPNKTPENWYFIIGEFGSFTEDSVPGRPVPWATYPQVIHRLLTLGEFGSFTQIPPRA